MGIQVEFNLYLTLRANNSRNRHAEECLPSDLESGMYVRFRKKGQRIYRIDREIPLLKTDGNGKLSNPIASVLIEKPTHELINKEIWTTGHYRIMQLYSPSDSNIHSESNERIANQK
jgi:hypothetical protein